MKDDDEGGDEGGSVSSDGGEFKLFEGFCFLTDRLMDKRTNRHW